MNTGLPAVFFDRDDTLIHDVPYGGDPAQVRLKEGAREALERLRTAGFRLFVLSNQSGVGRGLITMEQVHAVNAEMLHQIGPPPGDAPWFDDILICPHAPEENCACRKPSPRLAEEAAARHGLDLSRSFLVGDKVSDIQCAHAAGMRGILLETGKEPQGPRRTQSLILADHRTRTLAGAAGWIITFVESSRPEYAELAALGWYVYHNFNHLYTEEESRCLNAAMKALKGPSWGSDPLLNPDRHHPVTEHILSVGLGAYLYEVAQRILVEHGDAVYINRCDKCGHIVRTPTTTLCTWCGHSWPERREELRQRARSAVYNPPEA